MLYFTRALVVSATIALARAQGVLVSGKGSIGESTSMGVSVDDVTDANYISQDEIIANIVNACGRTVLKGGLSQAGETESIIASGKFTRVQAGGTLTITVAQRSAQGSGPFACDLDESSNVLGVSGQTNLTVAQDASQFGTGNLTLTVTMPSNLTCIGASAGNFCTVRCVNQQNYGGCLAVQQSDITPSVNDPSTIASKEFKNDIAAQVKQNDKDLSAANKGLAAAASHSDQGINIANALLDSHGITAAVAVAAAATSTTTSAAAATTTAKTGKSGKSGKSGSKLTGSAGSKLAGGTTSGKNIFGASGDGPLPASKSESLVKRRRVFNTSAGKHSGRRAVAEKHQRDMEN